MMDVLGGREKRQKKIGQKRYSVFLEDNKSIRLFTVVNPKMPLLLCTLNLWLGVFVLSLSLSFFTTMTIVRDAKHRL